MINFNDNSVISIENNIGSFSCNRKDRIVVNPGAIEPCATDTYCNHTTAIFFYGEGIADACEDTVVDDAVKYDVVTHTEVLEKNLKVMDSTAASLCRDNNISILVFNLEDPENIVRAILGENIGTIVKEG